MSPSLYLAFIVTSARLTLIPAENEGDLMCYPDEFRCWPNQCMSACIVCDGIPDCQNYKDEDTDFCEQTWQCPLGFKRCAGSRQCIRDYLCCNGDNDCQLGTDENAQFCESYECPEGYSRCYGSRQCSLEYYFCDGEFDCDVGTDEDPAICVWTEDNTLQYEPLDENVTSTLDYMSVPCWPGDLRCWPTRCISACVACDGFNDCKDNFDESQAFCETWECPGGFERCSGSRQCIRDYLFCDDIDNCGIGTDEDVAFCATWECPQGYDRCYGSRQCVLSWFFNDGQNDCNVGTDEYDEFLAGNYDI